jgi:uncharacterized protein
MTFALPSYAHIPGQTARHFPDAFDDAKASALAVTEDATVPENQAWLYGLELLAMGFYWECHEVLETVWLRARPNSQARAAVQGVIQIANAALKLKMQKPKAANRLASMAELHFKDASGIDGRLAMGLKHEQIQLALMQIRSGRVRGLDFR